MRHVLAGYLVLLATAQLFAQVPTVPDDPGAGAVRGSIVEDRAAKKLLEAGDARLDSNEATKAVEIWKSVIERYPRSRLRFDAHLKLGNYFLDRERVYDRARVHFEAAGVEENSSEEQRAEATLKLGVCFYHARNFGKSFQVMRDVIEKFPVSPEVNEAYYYIGLGHFQLGHYSRAIQALEKVGGKAVMTSPEHESGTDRIAEAAQDVRADIIVNLQGDEPFIDPIDLDNVADALASDPYAEMATLKQSILDARGASEIARSTC